MTSTGMQSQVGLDRHGIENVNVVYWNLSTPLLYEEALRRREGRLAHLGPLVVRTGQHTGRSPRDKFIVREPSSESRVWWGDANRPLDPERFTVLRGRLLSYLQDRDLFVQDCFVGADPRYRVPIRVITETAWHSLFARNMFIQATPEELAAHTPEFTVIQAPSFHAVPEVDGTQSEAFIVVHFGEKLVLIGGTQYAGEIKKSIFSVMNFLLPQRDVLTMHSSANIGPDGKVAVFFGLSGTGKTTLSADTDRTLIGDDEHGWSDLGIFNLEGGCYAKVIRLSREAEPEIYETTRRFGTILENVWIDSATGRLDLDDASLTENTRAAYPVGHIPNATTDGMGGHPSHIIMLTADAFGVLPPIARLTPAQAMYHFLSGYTAKVAGTEKGVKEPQATFSACFGAPFMSLPPSVYAELLGQKIAQHDVEVWLVNTGWSGGPYGTGRRMAIAHTRAMVRAALTGALAKVPTAPHPVFGVAVPTTCPGVPSEVLDPRSTWSDPQAYDTQARKLAGMFADNFRAFASTVTDEVRAAGPRASDDRH
ncbi:MAG: phosphoenolpyruvate carboxykinase [Vicinamibacterales bacterium]